VSPSPLGPPLPARELLLGLAYGLLLATLLLLAFDALSQETAAVTRAGLDACRQQALEESDQLLAWRVRAARAETRIGELEHELATLKAKGETPSTAPTPQGSAPQGNGH